MSLSIVDKNLVREPEFWVGKINNSLGWERDTGFIIRKYIRMENSVVFDFIKPTTATEYRGYTIVRKDSNENDAAYLSFIAVDQSMHKQGMGSHLLNSTVEKVKKFAYKKLTLDCEEHNLGFYT